MYSGILVASCDLLYNQTRGFGPLTECLGLISINFTWVRSSMVEQAALNR